jgi:hypothetical protein
MRHCAWLACRRCSNLCRPWLLPLLAWRALLRTTSTEARKRANATEHALYVLCTSCFRAAVEMESSAWYAV